MPRSPAARRTMERRSVLGKARENPLLIKRRPGIDVKGIIVAHPADGGTQKFNLPHQQIIAIAFEQVHRKEPGAARQESASEIGFIGRAAPLAGHIHVPSCHPCVRLRCANRTYA